MNILTKEEVIKQATEVLPKGCISDDDIRRKAVTARAFMQSHPAIGEYFDSRCFWWSLQEVCKRGITKDGPISVYYDSPEGEKFKAEFEEENADELEAMKKHPFMYSLYKSYEEVYGEPWVYDHVEYWWELSFLVFDGDISRESKDRYKNESWGAYGFEQGGALTFEQCLVDAAEVTKKYLGDFDDYKDFHTDEEKANHEEKNPFSFVPSDVIHHNPITGKEEKCSTMEHNDDYLNVHSGMINRRWLAWYAKTDRCKKDWDDQFDIKAALQP